MPLYLSEEMVGAGKLRDPFRPRGYGDQPGWSVLYLGDTGKSLLWLPSASADPGLTLLSDDKADTMPAQTKTALGNKLSMTLTLQNASDVVAEVMLTPDKGWNPVRATHLGLVEIWMGGVLWHSQLAIKGAAVETSTFTGTESPLSESGKWVNEGSWTTMKKNGAATCVSVGGNSGARCTTDLGSADQYSQANCTQVTPVEYPALLCRMATNVSYFGEIGLGDAYRLYKSNSSLAFTEIGSAAGSPTSGPLYRLEVSGSTLTLKAAGSTVRTETDTTITSGNFAGISAYSNGGSVALDNWEGGSLGAGATKFLKDLLGGDFMPVKR